MASASRANWTSFVPTQLTLTTISFRGVARPRLARRALGRPRRALKTACPETGHNGQARRATQAGGEPACPGRTRTSRLASGRPLPGGTALTGSQPARQLIGSRARPRPDEVCRPRGERGHSRRRGQRPPRVVRGVSRGVSGILPGVIVLEVSRPYDVIEARLGGDPVGAGNLGSRFRLRHPHPTLTNP